MEAGRLVLKDSWSEAVPLEPRYADVFSARGRTIVFRGGAAGGVEALVWSESRVWGLRFGKVG